MHNSELISLRTIIEEKRFFNIPIYQRLYVWGEDQIKVLLDDLVAACEDDKPVFYLGGTLVIEQEHSALGYRLFDLIDGQQRFTTLWLISITFQRLALTRSQHEKNYLADYRFADINDRREPRIRFAIRQRVTHFFDILLNGQDVPSVEEAINLSKAINEIEGYFNNAPHICLEKLSQFLLERVQLVFTRVPVHTDLNKLFEVINNRGVQLQHHEILKARLLAQIEDGSQRQIYGQIWDACSYMSDYVEKNLRDATGLKLTTLYDGDRSTGDNELLAKPSHVIEALSSLYGSQQEHEWTLTEILADNTKVADTREIELSEEYESDRVRSIITFSMLLQHVLRIFLVKRNRPDIDKILDKDLLKIFQDNFPGTQPSESAVKEFIELLWQCRYLFDKHIIKWVEDEDEDVHSIRRLRVNESKGYKTLVRESRDSDTAFAMLQSMLYHSQQLTTHYWLTPLLNYLLINSNSGAHTYLKFLDNYLLCSKSEEPLAVRTRNFLENYWYEGYELTDIRTTLNEPEGTGFPHYWFYKLEYILWEQFRQTKGPSWQAFRMTAKNSVEHVSPQHPEEFDSNKVSDTKLNSFGNLGLVSRSINSGYGKKPFIEKRARFLERNAVRADSLKLALIYENESWNDEQATLHQNSMIEAYIDYFSAVEQEVKTKRNRTKEP